MRYLLVVAFLAFAGPALANPMLDKCLPFAPAACGLTEKSTQEEFLTCFEKVSLNGAKKPEAVCAEELAHARVHKACGAVDIPKVCAGVKPGENRVMGCLRKHRKDLGKECREALFLYDLSIGLKTEGGERKKGRGGAVHAVRC